MWSVEAVWEVPAGPEGWTGGRGYRKLFSIANITNKQTNKSWRGELGRRYRKFAKLTTPTKQPTKYVKGGP